MGKTRIQDMTRAQALRDILALKKEIEFLQDCCKKSPSLKVTWGALDELEEFRKHKNYHVRVQAWKAQECPMPKGKDHNKTIELTIELAQDVQPNQVARYFAQQDEELKSTISAFEESFVSDAQVILERYGKDSEVMETRKKLHDADVERAKEFTNVMKQQFCVSLLARISGQGMVM